MKYKKILVNGEFLIKMSEENNIIHARCIKGLPEGTKFCYSIPTNEYYGIYIVIEHESFPNLNEGDLIPNMDDPVWEAINV